MSPAEHAPNLVPSLLDRLLDDAPTAARDPVADRFQGLRQLKRSVARDLEALLNTRREALAEVPSDFTEVNRSLFTYGLPDFTSFNLRSHHDRARIRLYLEEAIAMSEPRLDRVRVSIEAPREHDRTLRFRVDALLRVDPAPEPVTFDTVLRLNTQEYVVQGQD
jgi:type VI secretion system protein ImpF